MGTSFEAALNIAKAKYPHQINHFEEYRDYFVFDHDDGVESVGGPLSPVVIRKSDGAVFNYEAIFFNLGEDAEDVGGIVSQGKI